ncbi:MAG: phosphoglycerate dehydrogenase [Vampirovibrio sp.]
MPKILVTDQIHENAVAILSPLCDVKYVANVPADELVATLKDCDGVMIRSASTITAEVLRQVPHLQIIGRAGVGVDNVDLAAANQQGVVVVNSPEGNTVAAAEHTIGLMFALARHIPQGDASLKAGRWDRKSLTGIELFNKTLGLIGLGKIGSRVAKVAKSVGMKIVVYDPFISKDVVEALGARHTTQLTDIWKHSDFITVHVPKTKDTLNLLNTETLKQCKAGVRIINCARGGIINESDLADALRTGHVAGAALDVYHEEPLNVASPLLAEDLAGKVVLTPHLGASTEEAQVNVALDVAEQLRDFFATGALRSVVNSPLLRSEVMDPIRPYLPLGEAMGRLGRQLATGGITQVELIAKGSLAEENIAPLSLAVLKGLLSVNREGVNYINATSLAKSIGITVQESKSTAKGSLPNLLTIILTNDQGIRLSLSGTVMAPDVIRIVDIEGFKTSLKPTDYMLMVPHEDKPGMIAQIGTILGNANINISALQVGKSGDGDKSIMLFNLDSPVEQEVLSQLGQVKGCYTAKALSL